MTAIVSGNSLGIELTSLAGLGDSGVFGTAKQGNSGEQVYVNAATGNLVVQRRDEFLAGTGQDAEAVRTYNSLGQFTDDNGDNWSLGVYAQQLSLSGVVNTEGSTLTRTARDGSQAVYTWNATRARYITRDGSGAHDGIVFDDATNQYVRSDGSSGDIERYAAGTGRLLAATDANGNGVAYTYDDTTGLLISAQDASGETLRYDYAGNRLTGIRAEFKNTAGVMVTRSTVRYAYDSAGRLSTVTVDLTPDDGAIADNKVYKTTYSYDGTSKRLKTLTQSDGSSLTFTYIEVGGNFRVESITDALGAVTRYAYDTAARRTTVTDPLDKTWVVEYDDQGQLTQLTSPAINGYPVEQSYTYDADGNVTSITDGDGETVTMAYDANGNPTRVTNAVGHTVVRTYSADNRLLTETVSTLTPPTMVNKGGIDIVGNNIVKIGGNENTWDSSVRSSAGLTGGASVGFKPVRNDKALMVGLTADPGANHSFNGIDFALYCTYRGTLQAYENGQGIDLGTTYAAGDDLRVTYDGSKVTYLKNGAVLRTVAATISTPLFVDTSFYHRDAAITALTFGTSATNANAPLVAESNTTVAGAGVASKTSGTDGSWDASVRGLVGYTGGAVASFRPLQTDKAFMVGLNSDPSTDDGYRSIDYAFYCKDSSVLQIYESGVAINTGQTYAVGDTLKVVYDGDSVKYLKNNTVVREVAITITRPLSLDSSFYHGGAAVDGLQFGQTTPYTVMAAARESGLIINADSLRKSGGSSGVWDSAARSDVGYVGQAHLSFSAGQTNRALMIGLNTDPDSGSNWSTLDWAFFLRADGLLEIREAGSGNVLDTTVPYTAQDRLQITYDGTSIRYLMNGAELRKVAATIIEPLYADTSFYHVGAKVINLRFGDRVNPDLTTRNVYSAEHPEQLRYAISAQGRVTQYVYDSNGQRISEITYPQKAYSLSGLATNSVPTEAQLNGWVTAIGDLSNTTRKDFVYDARGLLHIAKTYYGVYENGSGQYLRQTQYIHDQAGRLLQSIENGGAGGDEAGNPTTAYTYDGLGRVLTVTQPGGGVTTTVYGDGAQTITLTTESGGVAASVFDKAGRLLSLTRSGSGSTRYAYDDAGRLLMTTDPTGVRSFRLYDEAGRLVATVDGDGTLTETAYDKAGRGIRVVTYATAVNTALLVDASTGRALNPALSAVRPAAQSADLNRWNVYDNAGRLAYEIGDNGLVTQLDHDGAGRLVRRLRYAAPIPMYGTPTLASVKDLLHSAAVYANADDNRSERFVYDADGLLIASIDAEGYLTRHSYDYAGRKIETRRYAAAVAEAERAGGGTLAALLPPTDTRDQVETYFYDAQDLLVGTVDAAGYITRNTYNYRQQLRTQTRYATPVTPRPAWTVDLDTFITDAIRPGGVDALTADDRRSYWTYTLAGQLLKTTNFEGTSTAYEYDEAGRLLKTTVGAGLADARSTQASYDAWGRQLTQTSAEGSTQRSTYDSAGRLTSRTDANGFKTLFFYDADGRLTYQVNARGEVEETEYNTLGQQTATIRYGNAISLTGLAGGLVTKTLTDAIAAKADAADDARVSYAYDGSGQLNAITNALRQTDRIVYNLFGEVSERTSFVNSSTSRIDKLSYDRRGLLAATIRDAADGGINASVQTRYDAFGRATWSQDANGRIRTQAYDRLGRTIVTTAADGRSRETEYDAFGQVIKLIDERDKGTTYTYDKANRKVTMTTSEGVKVTTAHSRYGQTVSVTDGNNVVTSYTYDLDGQLLDTKVGSTIVEHKDYDAGGRLTASTDARGIRTTYTYDAAGRMLTRTLDPTQTDADVELSITTSWAYDAKGQAVKMTDARGVVTQYEFDLEGRNTRRIVDPGGLNLSTRWEYDGEDRVVRVFDAKDVETRVTFDKLGRRIKEQLDPTGLNLTHSTSYDDNGNVLTSTDARGKVTRYEYDAENRLTYTIDAAGSVTLNQYDVEGQLVKVIGYVDTVASTQAGSEVSPQPADRVIRYAYDNDGRLEFTVDALSAVTRNEYDGNGNVVKRIRYFNTLVAGTATIVAPATHPRDQATQFEYDAFNRQTWQANAMGQVTYNQYDATGNLVLRRRYVTPLAAGDKPSEATALSSDRIERFVFDAANRLTYASDANGSVTQTKYDKNGNVVQVVRHTNLAVGISPNLVVADPAEDRVNDTFYDRANRAAWSVDSLGYVTRNSFDANGNITETRRYADPPNSRSQPSTAAPNDTLDRVEKFAYDDANRLSTSTDALGNTEAFTYDGAGNKLSHTNKSGDTWNYSYDALGRLATEAGPAVTLYSSYVRESDGLVVLGSATEARITTKLTYDTFGNLKTRTEALGRSEERTTSYEYDKLGRQIKVTYPTINVAAKPAATLAASMLLGTDARDEIAFAPTAQTFYDVFGNAVASTVSGPDRIGVTSYKSYDAAGRVSFEVDALGYVTGYTRNAFGEATTTRRYAVATKLNATAPADADTALTTAAVSAAVNAAGVDHTEDRALSTAYDKAGRVIQVSEPRAYTYDSTAGEGDADGSKITKSSYNAFGELIKVSELVNRGDNTWANTTHYHDLGGRRKATVDAMGYLTTRSFDRVGNLTGQTEFDNALKAGSWDDAAYAAATPDAERDRSTGWTWDKLNRKLTETQKNALHSTASNGSSTRADLTTRYGYDAVGNLIYTTDAAGGVTRTYYDALGRISAVLAPARSSTIDGETIVPVTEFRRDAHGNVVCRIERSNTATEVTATTFKSVYESTDRYTSTVYDLSGNATQVVNADRAMQYSTYTADGKLAKTWQTVTDNDDAQSALFTAYGYDKLGRLLNSYSPSPASPTAVVSTNYDYNAFGEVVRKGKNSGWQESFEYDNAGRLWKTNSQGGIAKVFLYDLRGRQTAEIASAGSGRAGSVDVATATSAVQAAGWSNTRRVNIKYNALGQVTERVEAERVVKQGGITLRKATASAAVISSTQRSGNPNSSWVTWSGTNSARLTWTNLGYLGSGEIRVDLTYAGTVPDAATLTESQIFQGHEAAAGVVMSWTNASGAGGSQNGGLSAIKRMVVYKKNVDGAWIKVIDRSPEGDRPFGDYGTQLEISSPLDRSTAVSFKYRKVGTADWITVSSAGLTSFGDSHWFDTSTLAGTYEYEVYFTEKDRTAERTESGRFVAKTTDVDDDDKSEVWERPVIRFTRDRWGNALSQSDPRNETWKTYFTYNHNNQVVEEKRPDAAGDLSTSSPTRSICCDKLGRQVAIRDERGFVNGQAYDSAGNLIRETHADGGVITHAYDIFGQKVQTIDAVGNAATGGSTKTDHTTRFDYDKAGRLLRTTHGITAGGSLSVLQLSGGLTLVEATLRKNLTESFTYDEAGRKLTQTNGQGETIRYWYDRAGNVVRLRQPLGQETKTGYNVWGFKASEVDANGNDASWSTNYFGRILGHKDIGEAVYSYVYDAAGQLTAQTTDTAGAPGRLAQNLRYGYDAAGGLVRIDDLANNRITTYALDLSGRHLREKVATKTTDPTAAEVFQDNHLAYDTLGRLTLSSDNRVLLTFQYDAAGNRTRIASRVLVDAVGNDDVESLKAATRYFQYDEMNRQTVVDGIDAEGNISAAQGHKIGYDVNGNRTSDTFWGNKVQSSTNTYYLYDADSGVVTYKNTSTSYTKTAGYVIERYRWDAKNRLQTVDRDGTLVDQRWYDGADRVVQSGPASLPQAYADKLNEGVAADAQIGLELRRQRYDANGRLQFQRVSGSDGKTLKHVVDYQGVDNGGMGRDNLTKLGYDAAGNVIGYEFRTTAYSNTTKVEQKRFEGYVQARTTMRTSREGFGVGSSTSSYDANGFLVKVDDATENTLDKNIVNDAAGRALRVSQNGNKLYTHIVNGEIFGQHGVAPDTVDPRTSSGQAKFSQVAEFEFGYRGISGSYPAPSVGAYSVRQGDTLQSIAQAAYGDSRQWWRIAQANGLQGEQDLKVGQTLTLPSIAAGESNNTTTFKPYDPSAIVGDTSPNLPQPKANDCGSVGQIIMIVVAVVVTIYTAGAAATWLGPMMSGTFATVGGVGLSAAGAMTVGAIGAAAGSVASQLVGQAIGAVDDFSWKQVGLAAVGGAVTAGVGGMGKALGSELLSNTVVRAAVSNAMTQGVSIAVGLQDHFSWMGVAAAAAGTMMGQAVGGGAGKAMDGLLDNQVAEKIVTGTLAGMASTATVTGMRGGRVSAAQIAADAFGNALGQGIVDQMQAGVGWGSAPDESAAKTARLKRYEADAAPSAQTQAYYDQIVGAFGGYDAGAADRSNDVLVADASGRATREQLERNIKDLRSLLANTGAASAASGSSAGSVGSGDDRLILDRPEILVAQENTDAQQQMFRRFEIEQMNAAATMGGEVVAGGLTIGTSFPFPAEQLPEGGFFRGLVLGQSGSVLDAHQPGFAENLGAGVRGLVLSPINTVTGLVGEVGSQYSDMYNLLTRSGESFEPSSALLNSLQREGIGGTLLNVGHSVLSAPTQPVFDLLEGRYEQAGAGLPGTLAAGVGIVGKFRGLKLGEGSATAFIDFNAVDDIAPGFYRTDPRQLRFMQPTVSPNYSAGGRTIASTADDLRLGRVTPEQLGDPLRVVMIDGKPFSFDNRRVLSYNLADVSDAPIQVMGLDDPVFAARVDARFNPIEGQGLRVVVTPSGERNSVLTDLYRRGMIQKPR